MFNSSLVDARGFTLVNILMAMLVLSIAVVGGMKTFLIAKRQLAVANEYRAVTNILQNFNAAMKNADTNVIVIAPITLSAADCSAPYSLQLETVKNQNQSLFVMSLLNNLSCQLDNANANGIITMTKDSITYQCRHRQHCTRIIF